MAIHSMFHIHARTLHVQHARLMTLPLLASCLHQVLFVLDQMWSTFIFMLNSKLS